MRSTAIVAGLLMILGATSALAANRVEPEHRVRSLHTLTLYKDPTCTCCLSYVSYLRSRKYAVKVVVLDAKVLDKRKRDLGVPAALDSCHTMLTADGRYFIEGHVPVDAMNKLFRQKPHILGIGLAGMPPGAPGMPGKQAEPFAIKQVSKKGKVSIFYAM